jgi:hypothetical protein
MQLSQTDAAVPETVEGNKSLDPLEPSSTHQRLAAKCPAKGEGKAI